MLNDQISFDELTGIRFLYSEKGDNIEAISFDQGIILRVVFDKSTKMINAIVMNGQKVAVTKDNIYQINKTYIRKNDQLNLNSIITINELDGINFVSKMDEDIITCFAFDNGVSLIVEFNKKTKRIISIKLGEQNLEVSKETIDYLKKLYGINLEKTNKKEL